MILLPFLTVVMMKAQAKEYGFEEDKSDSDDDDDSIRKAGGEISQHTALAQIIAAASKVSTASTPMPTPVSAVQLLPNGGLPATLPTIGLAIPGTTAAVSATGLPVVANDVLYHVVYARVDAEEEA